MPSVISPAQLDWDENGQPLSRVFGDVYFSSQAALDETRYVFLEQNRLEQRFAALADGECLVIGETGFGTGMNFLCAWRLFEASAIPGARLHFISTEKFPLALADLQRALALWPELAPWATALQNAYRAMHDGPQRLVFDGGRVTLTLLIGDAQAQLGQLQGRVDAWFLDGFAPAKNPEMWTAELFSEVARLSAEGATLGTFSAAGTVRRGLIAAGFKMKRLPGLGKKWEIMRGEFVGAPALPGKPWFAYPPKALGERQALVVGAGLAGCATAASLAARGWQVTLLERHGQIANEASGNPQGVLYLKLSAHGTALSQLILGGFGYTRRLLERLERGSAWDACGVLQLATSAAEAARQQALATAFTPSLLHQVSAAEASEHAGVPLPAGGLWFPEGGWVHPPALCAQLARHPNIQLRPYHDVLRLAREGSLWHAWAGERLLASAPVVVLACAAQVRAFEQTATLPLKPVRGQITRLPATAASAALATVVCAEGYVAPAREGEHTLGASFDFQRVDDQPSVAEHNHNLALLQGISPDLAERLAPAAPEALQGRVGLRCTSPDYLPIVGPVAEAGLFAEAYQGLRRNARAAISEPCPWLPGLWVNTGHGSRGLITAPLSGELIAAWLEHEPLPVARQVAEACHPNRFAVRRLGKGGAGG
ncbi:bifunctional tRNA (5-methylaminomethyl-2-thiouridine)(34)-methyltransferase MnmD/FAD-dependent 5-carboxymethylaminomethyl-2-thiouridine(34) oxidoreductase MnmC [Pseudomonas sp. RIT-PI-S]|uniref:bifunctional tRNA (5-methylaminomethyl-2-thiouridine)(34)-methyltransferase MnmD/FAD-dependent 5-carboxymethylaminomethyl-2-thiouridine(34) oxidoreductase MnmC n=1 Tax=Pseudomonas sp. RIT-PI-S TaxID=3035295 RepID=UPI0021D96B08|nr:bifunctional tRNA (5-methylaminomethyl-2-thiouridine)(34)-methyltransferase MnmD/FAD-dependent 5-carboxymethylaminomethyl-2-thiouridine(34) oxidoreductase MnmC [Pseudomonas sp. RIT-PI-S]